MKPNIFIFFIFLLHIGTVSSRSCWNIRKCLCYRDINVIDCVGKGLREVPTFRKFQRVNTEKLLLDNNDIRGLSIHFFNGVDWPRLRLITVRNNKYFICYEGRLEHRVTVLTSDGKCRKPAVTIMDNISHERQMDITYISIGVMTTESMNVNYIPILNLNGTLSVNTDATIDDHTSKYNRYEYLYITIGFLCFICVSLLAVMIIMVKRSGTSRSSCVMASRYSFCCQHRAGNEEEHGSRARVENVDGLSCPESGRDVARRKTLYVEDVGLEDNILFESPVASRLRSANTRV